MAQQKSKHHDRIIKLQNLLHKKFGWDMELWGTHRWGRKRTRLLFKEFQEFGLLKPRRYPRLKRGKDGNFRFPRGPGDKST